MKYILFHNVIANGVKQSLLRIASAASFLAALAMTICNNAYSQTNPFNSEWAFGVNGGVNLSSMRFNSRYYVPQGLLIQPSGGITVRYISENYFGIIGELNYSLSGWTEKRDTVNNAHLNEYTRSLAYLEMPLLTHLYFTLGKRAHFFINAGPQFRYNIGEKVKRLYIDPALADSNNPGDHPDYYNETSRINNKFDYGLKGEMGIEFRSGIGFFMLSGSYYFGLADVFSNTAADFFQASSNQIIGVHLTYLVPLTVRKK